jgi:hypothetical protein
MDHRQGPEKDVNASPGLEGKVECLIRHFVQIGRIAFLKPEVSEAMLPGAVVSGLNQIPRNIDAAPSFATGNAVVPSPQPRSRTLRPFVTPIHWTSASPLSHMLSAMRVKTPFSQSALFGFM